MTGEIVVFGATGYTGGLVVDALVRNGVRPVLAGRSSVRLSELADSLGLEQRLADASVSDGQPLVGAGDVLVATVGPFERYGHLAAMMAADAGAHYVDSTGEVGFVAQLRDRYHDRARQTGSSMLPAFGYDYVPGILAGALAAGRAGDAARSVDVGYFATGPLYKGLSSGTRATMGDGLLLPAITWREGQLVQDRSASQLRKFSIGDKQARGFLVSGTEVLWLPLHYPHLRKVTVYNGWFPRLSGLIRTGSTIANTLALSPRGRRLVEALTRRAAGPPGGPDTNERSRTRTHVVAVPSDADGKPVAEVHVEGPSIYTLTAELIAWAAKHLAEPGSRRATGVVDPIDLFGLDAFVTGCANVGLREQ